ncbi:hypothetical protein [Aquibacillus sediminis]|uniref:hypothetical protein n=1 Tax=Aquibacillus sediminis TaxID=2574734 RepID=UPI001109BE50|nr:hypothetical protein [Aquibacillus sediminis]
MQRSCSDCSFMNEKLKQHEQTITQLLAMVAVTNRKLNELTRKQEQLEQVQLQSPRIKVAPTQPQ